MHRLLSQRLTLLVAGLILATPLAHAQRPLVLDDLIGRRYDAERGLPDESATAMVQTPDGFLWFGTFSGLVRFDGVVFEVYTSANTPAMPDDGVVNLHLDRAGFLWCSTFAGMVRMKDGVWNRFGRDEGWTTDFARTFAEAPDGTLYVTGFDGKVLRLEGERFVELPPPPGPQQGALGHCDPEGRFWAVKGSFVGYLNGGEWKAVVEAPASGSDQTGGGPARDGALWVIRGDDLFKVGASGVIARFSLTRPVTDFWSLYEHSSGEVWIASYSNGLFRVRLEGERGEVSNYSRATGHGLSGVRFVCEDDEDSTWVGLNGMGLLRIRPRFFASYGIEAGLPEPNVKSVTVDRAGQVWIGTYGAGVFRVDTTRFGDARFTPVLPGSRAYVDSLLADRQGRVWVATFAPGSPVFRIENGQIREVLKDGAVNSSRSTLFEDSRGRLWLGGLQDLICCEGDNWTRHPLPEARALAEEPDTGVLWAATAHGLYRCDEAAFVEVMGPDGRSLNTGLCLRPESGGFLWIGTSHSGLLRRQPDGRFQTVNLGEPLEGIKIAEIVEDDLGFWWLLSDDGVVRARRDALAAAAEGQTSLLEASLYTAQDGLPRRIGATRRQPNAVKTPDGRLWLASVHGLTEVLPEAVQRNPRPPRVVVTAVRYIDARGAEIEVSPETSGRYEVAPGGRVVTIAFAALSYAAPERVICATRLERNGQMIRESWGHDRQVTYEVLSPGDYTIQITASNAHGVWNRTGVTVPLQMRPWCWQTVWFRVSAGVAMAGLVAGAVAGIDRHRALALRQRTTALLAERQRIGRDLHDGSQQSILATQMQIQLAREQWPKAPPDARHALATAEALNRQTLAETQLAVWDLRHETAPDTAVESLIRPVVATAASAGRLEAQLTSAGQSWPLPSTQMAELRRLVMEAVVNVMKHARARRLEVKLGFEPDQLVVDVRDDGCGFDLAAAHRNGENVGLGLTSMRERASRLKASFEILSAPGQGTRVRTVVPRPASEHT